MSAVDAAADRLAASIPSRTVYRHAVPNGQLPARYLLVRGSEGSEESTRACGTTTTQTPMVWVTSVSTGEPSQAAREAAWGSTEVRKALRDYRPEGRWSFTPEASQAPAPDTSTGTAVYAAVEQFSHRISL